LFCGSKPNPEAVRAFLAKQVGQGFSYPEVGASRSKVPRGYTVDHNRVSLGYGVEVFERAKSAIRQWKMFEMSWASLCWPEAPIEAGACVAVVFSHFGFWSMNAARIVYVVDEAESTRRFGFAYGTISDHAEIGEERFSVELDPTDEAVYYDIFAFSRLGVWARLGYPIARGLQRRFVRESKTAMIRAV